MGCYVDPLMPTEPSGIWPYEESCRLFADTAEELEAMRRQLRLSRAWLQKPGKPEEHYDLTAQKRQRALFYGAKEVTYRQMQAILERKRERPPESLAWRRVAGARDGEV